MTNGTSQGLFVLIAVIIFGIFVLIAYLLFQDKLTVGLATIFDDSFEQTKEDIKTEIVNEQADVEGFDEEYASRWGYFELSGDNKGIYVRYYDYQDTNEIYLVSVHTEKTVESQVSEGQNITGHLELPDMINNKRVVGLGVNVGTQDGIATFSQINASSVRLPKYLKTIPRLLFQHATNLTEIVGGLPTGVTSIGEKSFQEAKLSGEITIPSNVTEIDRFAFQDSQFTGDLVIPNSVTSIGQDAFKKSEFEGTLTLSQNLEEIEDYAFENSKFTGALELPDGLTLLGPDSFKNSVFTGQLTIPSRLTVINRGALQNSKFAGDLILPDKLETIDSYSLQNSVFTGELNIPDSMKTLGLYSLNASIFTGTFNMNNLESIQSRALRNSRFTEVIDNQTAELGTSAIGMSEEYGSDTYNR